VLKLNPAEFWNLTLRDFAIKLNAHSQEREAWERVVRLQTYHLLFPNVKAEFQESFSPMDVWVLPSEFKEAEKKRLEKERRANELFARSLGFTG